MQHALPCCPVKTLRVRTFAATSNPPTRSTLHALSARNSSKKRDNNDYRSSWKRTSEGFARASIREHTHGHAYSALPLLEADYVQAAMLCLEQTQIGAWNNARGTDRCGLRDEYRASRATGLTHDVYSGVNLTVLREKRVPDDECDHGYMQSRLQGPTGTASKGHILSLSSNQPIRT